MNTQNTLFKMEKKEHMWPKWFKWEHMMASFSI